MLFFFFFTPFGDVQWRDGEAVRVQRFDGAVKRLACLIDAPHRGARGEEREFSIGIETSTASTLGLGGWIVWGPVAECMAAIENTKVIDAASDQLDTSRKTGGPGANHNNIKRVRRIG